jgi:hypothetical protein
MKMKSYTAKIHNADLGISRKINLAIIERIFDDAGRPLSDAIIGAIDCRIIEIGAYWSNQTRGESGRYYGIVPLAALPVARDGREILIGID